MDSPKALSFVVPVVFSTGSETEELIIDPIADQDVEPDETIIISVLPGPGYDGGGAGGAVATIASDDFCPPIPIGYGEQLPGLLNDTSCVVDGEKTDTYTFEGQPGDKIAITVYADGFLPRAVLANATGLLDQAGGDGSTRDLRIPSAQGFTLPAAASTSYNITVSGLMGGSGEYMIALYKLPAAACTYTLSPEQTFIASTGGTFSFDVITQPGCPPESQPDDSGTIFKDLTYRGGRVTFDVESNPSLSQRTDVISVGQRTHSLIQYGRAVPTNDDFDEAEQLVGNNSDGQGSRPERADAAVNGNNTEATPQLNEPLHAGNPVAKSVWYYWTPPAGSGLYSFTTSGSNFDTVMAVYACPGSGDCLFSNVTPVGSNDDTTSFDKTSKVNFRASAGIRYMIAVDGKNGASGTIELTWRQYRRLFRLYLQNYNGNPSTLVPDSIVASNGSNEEDASRVSIGVYEFDLPADNTTYTVSISGPTGIVWDPNNFTLDPSSNGMDELMEGPNSGSQNSTSNSQDQTPRYITGYIQNLAAPDIPSLSVAISSSRGPNPRSEANCIPFGTTIVNSIQYVTYQCLSQPQTLHDIEPRMAGKNFVKPALSFSHPIEAAVKGTPATAFIATNVPTYGIAGRVLAGGAGTIVDLMYVPKGNSIEITRRTVTGILGAYNFPHLPSNQYKLIASRPGFVFTKPPVVDLQSDRGIDIPSEVACTYTPANLATIAQPGGLNQFSITTNDGRCEWQAASDVSWIVINSGATVGTGPVHFTVEPNNTGLMRIGTVRITDRPEPVSVRQAAGSSTPVTVSGNVLTPNGNGTRGTVTLTDQSGTRRTVTSNALGIFIFQNVASGAEYTIAVTSKRFRFAARTMQITEDVANVNFVGIE